MAGRKVFTSGEILTAADVNSFLMNQVVAVFADSTARSSAIPTPSEGMVTFREDQDVVEVYDGSAFKTVGGLVAVKDVLKTDTFSASVGAGGNVAVTDLSITHEVSDPANKVLLFASIGNSGTTSNSINCSFAFAEDGTLIGIGDASGSRTRVGSGVTSAIINGPGHIGFAFPLSIARTPGAGSKTYSIRVINSANSTQTVHVNRSGDTVDNANRVRSASSVILMEVAV